MVSASSQQRQRVRHPDLDAARRAQRPALGGAHREVVPLHAQLGALEREQLDDTAELEGAQAVVGQGDDAVTGWSGSSCSWRDVTDLWRRRQWVSGRILLRMPASTEPGGPS